MYPVSDPTPSVGTMLLKKQLEQRKVFANILSFASMPEKMKDCFRFPSAEGSFYIIFKTHFHEEYICSQGLVRASKIYLPVSICSLDDPALRCSILIDWVLGSLI